MPDTIKSWAQIKAEIVSNGNKEITPQRVTDALYSISQLWAGMYIDGGGAGGGATALSTTYGTLDLTDFTNHASSVGITPDKANDRFILPAVAGIYRVDISMALFVSSVSAVTYGVKLQLDGVDVPGCKWDNWRPASAAVGQVPFLSGLVVHSGSGNGYLTILARASAGTPTFSLWTGGIWVSRIA